MSSALGMGMLVERMALLAALMSTVTRMPPSSFGASTGLEIHGAGPICGSMMSASSILRISLSNRSRRWNGIGLDGAATGGTESSM